MNIKTRLRALILVTLLPVAVLGAATAAILVEKERETLEKGARDRVRTMMTAIDAELRSSITPLELLARSATLDLGELSAFRAEAERALESRSGQWVNVLLSDPTTGERVLNLLVSPGAPMPPPADRESILHAARTQQPAVSRVQSDALLGRPVFAVRVPVIRDGRTAYVVSALLDVASIERMVDRRAFPESWAVAVLDSNYRFVLRSPAPRRGADHASDSLKQALARSHEGWERGELLEGKPIYRAFYRSSFSGWSVSLAIPAEEVQSGLQLTWLLFAGVLGAAAAGLSVAWVLASRLTRPITALAQAAPSLARGDRSALPDPGKIDEVRELTNALEHAADQIRSRDEAQHRAEQALRAADRAKDEFLAMLGHELRNPLASISNAAQLLELAPHEPSTLPKVSGILQRQVQHMTHLVGDLLEVGRVTGGKIGLDRQPLDLAAAARDLIETWRSGGRFSQHQVHADLQSVWISADRARIEQVLSNLLENAIKYTPAQGRIDLSVRAEDAAAILEVRDNGAGMPPELVGRVFDLFVQGERSLAREQGGLGIGLTLAKRLVELHEGSIEAASEGPGTGSRFTVRLPAMAAPRPQAAPTGMPAPAARKRVLIVEDNADARESLAALLRHSGHEVRSAQSGLAGLELARQFQPEIALIDIGLPDVDGYDLARRLKADATTRSIRLIAVTGYGGQPDRQQALNAGFDRHLTKPVQLDTLDAVLASPEPLQRRPAA